MTFAEVVRLPDGSEVGLESDDGALLLSVMDAQRGGVIAVARLTARHVDDLLAVLAVARQAMPK